MTITTQFLTGFEHGFVASAATAGGGLFDIVNGGWSASTSSPRNGSYCGHLVAPLNTEARLSKTVTGGVTKIVMRFAVKVTSRPSSGQAQIAGTTAGVSVALQVLVSSTGVVSLQYLNGNQESGPTIDTTNWHLIEVQIDSAALTADWKVDGVAQTRSTASNNLANTTAHFGPYATGPAFTADFDDWIVGTWTVAATDWYGDGKVLAQVPGSHNAASPVNAFSPGDAGTVYAAAPVNDYQLVDDPPGTGGWTATRSTTDNIALRSASASAVLSMLVAPTAEAGQANAVRALLSYSSPSATANLAACDAASTGSGGGTVELWGLTGGVGKDFSEITNFFKGAIVPRPTAGWTAAQVNQVIWRFGGCTSVDISPVPTVQALMLEVDWPISAPSGTDLFATPADTLSVVDVITPLLISPILLPLDELLNVTDTLRYQELGGTYTSLGAQYTDYLDLANAVKIDTGTAVPLADTLTIADQATSVAVLQRSLADPLTVVDVQALRSDALRALADTLGIADLATPVLTAGSIAHEVPLADLLTAVDASRLDVGKLLADPLTILDGQALQSDVARALADTLTVLDAVTPAADRAQALADTLTVADQLAALTATLRTLADTLTITDVLGSAAGYALAPADGLGVADQQALLQTVALAFPEALTLTDLASPLLGGGAAHTVPLADVLAIADNLDRLVSFDRILADPLTVADVLSSAAAYALTTADTLTVADQLALLQAVALSLADSLGIADLATPLLSAGTPYLLPLADALALADGLTSTAAYQRSFADPLTLTDGLGNAVTMLRTDTLTVADLRSSVLARSADLADTLTVIDASARTHAALRSFPETLTLADLLTPSYVQYRPPRLTMIL